MLDSRVFCLNAISLILLMTGCSGGPADPKLNSVVGKVTLDGEPLSDAVVTFIPDRGPASGAITDEEGNYDLKFKSGSRGAVSGKHTVTISTDIDGSGIPSNERVPDKYNKNTNYTVVVKEGGQTENIDLYSK